MLTDDVNGGAATHDIAVNGMNGLGCVLKGGAALSSVQPSPSLSASLGNEFGDALQQAVQATEVLPEEISDADMQKPTQDAVTFSKRMRMHKTISKEVTIAIGVCAPASHISCAIALATSFHIG